MDERQQKIAVGVVAALALVGGIAALVVLGGGDTVRDLAGGEHHEPTAEPQMDDTAVAYAFDTEEIEECGETCRDVTATLSNTGDEDADDVVVETTIFADGDVVWDGDEQVGTLQADESFTSTQRIDVGVDDAARIEANDGYVTIETIVRFDDGQDVFVDEENVS